MNHPLVLGQTFVLTEPSEHDPGEARVSRLFAAEAAFAELANQHPRTRTITNSELRAGV